ncbi:MAG: efflux RND transporter permease subunit, partial [Bacteroidota bacterium]
ETLNFIILFALIVVLGILVDFSIVVVENIQVHFERGLSAWESAQTAVREVGWPVTAGLGTTAVVFAPLLFWSGIVGEYMKYLPVTLIITLSSALFVALVAVPVAAGYVIGGEREDDSRSPWVRRFFLGVLAFLLLAVLLASPLTVAALLLITAALYLLYRFLLAPGTAWFRSHALPALERRYRRFVEAILERDYSVRRPYLRNTAALSCFAAGAVLLFVGGLIAVSLGRTAALPALVPGGLLAVVGAAGIFLHALEVVFLGGGNSIRIGLVVALVMLPFGIAHFVSGDLTPGMTFALLFPPLVFVGVGFFGAIGRKRHRYILTDNRAMVLNAALAAVLASGGLFAATGLGASFMPDTDPNQIRVTLEMPAGTNIEASNRTAEQAVARIENLLVEEDRSRQNVESIVVNVGVTGGGPFGGTEPDPRRTRITLEMVDYQQRAESSRETIRKIRGVMERFPGAIVTVEQDEMGPPTDPPFVLDITGPDFDVVADLAVEAEQLIREAQRTGRIQGLVDMINTLELGRPELRVDVDRERASLFGLSTSVVAATVRSAVEGQIAGAYRVGEDEYDIRVRLREADRQTLQSLEALELASEGGAVPLLAAADLRVETGPGTITRVDLQPVASLEGDVSPAFTTAQVLEQTDDLLAEFREGLPEGYSATFAGEAEEQEEAFDFLAIALILGIALMALVLITKFNAVVIPLIILTAVVLTMSGVLLGLIATRSPFSLMTFLAVISLAGIVADDDIVMGEFILRNLRGTANMDSAVIEGATSRFRQVTLTAITTIIGLIPLTLGFYFDFQGMLTELRPNASLGSENSQFWAPLGSAIIAGLPVATLVTLVVVPAIYS